MCALHKSATIFGKCALFLLLAQPKLSQFAKLGVRLHLQATLSLIISLKRAKNDGKNCISLEVGHAICREHQLKQTNEKWAENSLFSWDDTVSACVSIVTISRNEPLWRKLYQFSNIHTFSNQIIWITLIKIGPACVGGWFLGRKSALLWFSTCNCNLIHFCLDFQFGFFVRFASLCVCSFQI